MFSRRTSAVVVSLVAVLALAGCGDSAGGSSAVTTGGQAPSMSMPAGDGDDGNAGGGKPSGPDCAGKQAHDEDYGDVTVNVCPDAKPSTVTAKALKPWVNIDRLLANGSSEATFNQPPQPHKSCLVDTTNCYPLQGQPVYVACVFGNTPFDHYSYSEYAAVLLGEKSTAWAAQDSDTNRVDYATAFTNIGDKAVGFVKKADIGDTGGKAPDCLKTLHSKGARLKLYGSQKPNVTLDPSY